MANYKLSKDPWGVHQKVLKLVGTNNKILEIGCSTGYLTRLLRNQGNSVTCVEINAITAKKAMKYASEMFVGDVEKKEILNKVLGKKFDAIILTDVVEHLINPETVLNELNNCLNKNGSIILSTPNVVFLTNRLKLLMGKFEYDDTGIMDKSHLRFFTKETLLRMVKNSGLKLTKFDFIANFTQLPLYMKFLFPFFRTKYWWRHIEYNIASLWPEGLAVQFLIICKKS